MNLKTYSIVEGQYLQDILNQPRALEDTLRYARPINGLDAIVQRLQQGEFRQVILTGMGSSFHVLYPLYLRLNAHGVTTLKIETSELVHYLPEFLQSSSLIIAVSQSGHSAEMIRLIEMNGRGATLIAVTNTAESPLARGADAVILTHAGPEYSVSAKTYVTALMVLERLATILCGGEDSMTDMAHLPEVVGAYLDGWRNHVAEIAETLGDIRHLFLVGRGRSLAAVNTGALILKEATRFHAEGMSSAAFRHGPMEMLTHDTFVTIFQGDPPTRDLNQNLGDDVIDRLGRSEQIGQISDIAAFCLPASSPVFLPILEILPVQMMTLALTAQAGVEAGKFSLTTKITTIE